MSNIAINILDKSETYLMETALVREPYSAEECTGPEEARAMAAWYREMIGTIDMQLENNPQSVSSDHDDKN